MIKRMKALPQKIIFAMGLALLLVGYVIIDLISFHILSLLFGGTFILIGILFIAIASDKKHSNIK